MKRFLLASVLLLGVGQRVVAQAVNPLLPGRDTTINALQFRNTADLDTLSGCLDASLMSANGPTWITRQAWKVRGVIVIPGIANVTSSETTPNRHVWMRQIGGGPFSGIGFRFAGNTSPDDMRTLQVGDTVEVTGTVTEFNGETQLNPVRQGGVRIVGLWEPGSPKPQAEVVEVGSLNNASGRQQLTTGEQWEGNYVEVRNVRVVAVQRYFASNANRVQFTVQDPQGNRMVIRDRFYAMRLPNCSTSPINLCGTFNPPSVGDVYRVLRGIILHSKQNCTGPQGNNGGYELHPFDSLDMVKGVSAPFVVRAFHSPFKPSSTIAPVITAAVNPGTDSAGRPVNIVRVVCYYSTDSAGSILDSVIMTNVAGGNNYTATLPIYPEGTRIRYYIKAVNTVQLATAFPDVTVPNNGIIPLVITIGNGPVTIRDVQFNPLTEQQRTLDLQGNPAFSANNMISPALGQTVTVRGVVTADTTMNGVFFMEDLTETRGFNAIMIRSDNLNAMRAVRIGQTLEVTGVVNEDFSHTFIQASNITNTGAPLATVTPTVINQTALNTSTSATNWTIQRESLESKLLKLVSDAGDEKLYVRADTFRSSAAGITVNNSEWLVGIDRSVRTEGTAIRTGFSRTVSRNSVASLYASFINYVPDSTNLLRVADQRINDSTTVFLSISGIAYHSFGNVKILPRTNADMVIDPASVARAQAATWKVYPNPAHSTVNLQISQPINQGQVQLIDAKGRLLIANEINGTDAQLNLSAMSSGLYTIRCIDSKGRTILTNKISVIK